MRACAPAVEPLSATAMEPVACHTAWTLGQIGALRAVGPLVAVFPDLRGAGRETAVSALEKLGRECPLVDREGRAAAGGRSQRDVILVVDEHSPPDWASNSP